MQPGFVSGRVGNAATAGQSSIAPLPRGPCHSSALCPFFLLYGLLLDCVELVQADERLDAFSGGDALLLRKAGVAALNTGAYYGEILRAGIESVPAGQIDAARSTGLGRLQTSLFVVLPQAVRNVLPDLLSNTLEVVKLTSLGSVVAMPELLFQARQAQSVTYNPTPIVLAAIIYFMLLWPLVRVVSRLENRAAARG